MTNFTMMIGIPGSGKSTSANILSKKNDSKIISSDAIRLELFGDESYQGENNLVFEEMKKRTLEALNKGESVIYDATNVNRRKRMQLLQLIGDGIEKIACVMLVNLETALLYNSLRDRKVDKDVIVSFMKRLSIPQYSEGWDHVHFGIYEEIQPVSKNLKLEDLTFTEFTRLLKYLDIGDVINSPQNTPYHSLSIDRHTYRVYEYLNDEYFGSDKHLMLLSAIFHDTGKNFCRETDGKTLYDRFYGHEYVSAQKAALKMLVMNYSVDEVLFVVDIIQNHMLYHSDDKYNKDKKLMITPDKFKLLELFLRADESGK